jgi:hypothetical protein
MDDFIARVRSRKFDEPSTSPRLSPAGKGREPRDDTDVDNSNISATADEGDKALDEFATPTHSADGRSSVLPKFDRKAKRRQEQEPGRLRKLFDPAPVIQLLRGRYRAVWREMRRTLSASGESAARSVYQVDPYYDEDDPGGYDRTVDFESMLRNAVEDFEREGGQVRDDRAPN